MRAARAFPSPPGGGFAGANVPYVFSQSAIPFIHVSSGTMGNNGALSAITALPTTYSGGAWVYYPVGAIVAASAAGWYWTVFSSTTAGTVFNSTYTSGTVPLGTQTAFATTGPGAFTGDIAAARAGPTITIPANAMGPNGSLRVRSSWAATNNANAKVGRVSYGGTAFMAQTQSSLLTVQADILIRNRGATNVQIASSSGGELSFAAGTAYPTPGTVDSTAAQTFFLSLNNGTATDNHILDGYTLEILYAP